jgi:hypothetical protein
MNIIEKMYLHVRTANKIILEGLYISIVIAATASFEILVDNSSVAASYCTIINTIQLNNNLAFLCS